MQKLPSVLTWDDLSVGLQVEFPLNFSHDDMDAFRHLSGDKSRIHVDSKFAERNGFDGVVVYGALIVAKLSYLVGMHLPGDLGLATEWKINFNRPLYVDDAASMQGQIIHVSEATRTVMLKFTVTSNGQIIATGSAGSKVLNT